MGRRRLTMRIKKNNMVFSRPNIESLSAAYTVHDDDDENEWHPYIYILLLYI